MKKFLALPLLVFSLSLAVVLAAPAEQADMKEIKLSVVALKDIDRIFTPGHKKKQLVSNIDLPAGESRGIRCSVGPNNVLIDTNLDGEPDTKVSSSGKMVKLTIQTSENAPKRPYYVILTYSSRYRQRQWYYESATAVQGTVNGKKLLIVDDNCNGNFADYGEDGLIVAPSKSGWFLSSTIDTGKELVEIEVDPDGSTLSYRPFYGDTGTIDPFKKLKKASFKPKVFVVKQEDRSFNVIRPNGRPSSVPVGTYTIERGVIDRLTEFVGFKHPPFDVLKDNTTTVEWGGPFTFLFFESPAPNLPAAYYGVDSKNHVFYLEPPYVLGEKGEAYIGSKNCEPEQSLRSPFSGEGGRMVNKDFFIAEKMNFNIEILHRKSRKVMNKNKFYSGGQPADNPNDPAPYYWNLFSWVYGDLRGKYILRVTAPQSKYFKKAVYEKPIELK